MSKILVINAGSSSIKLSLFNHDDKNDNLQLLASGLAERIGLSNGNIVINFEKKHKVDVDMKTHTVAVEEILKLMNKIKLIEDIKEIKFIGFRVVQGGEYFKTPTLLSEKEINIIDELSIYAPLHNPGAVQAIRAFRSVMPHASLSANFDTAFHVTIDKVNSTYAIPYEWTEKFGVKRYGMHGISHKYITEKLKVILNKDKVTFINLHIGNGASVCAVKDSASFDTSMGLTPLAGIMMGTRSGDIDPSIHEFLTKKLNVDISVLTDYLNKKSGLLGVSGISSDMRDVTEAAAKGNQRAKFALDLFAQKIADYTAMYANKLGKKLDAIVFTAGIGENAANVRENVVDRLNFKNIIIDQKLNYGKIGEYQLISSLESEVKVFVIRTNEELLIAQHAIKLNKNQEIL